MILKVLLIGILVVTIGLLLLYAFLINNVRKGKYKVNGSFIAQEAENKYGILYPNVSINDLKNEIEKVAELLINGEESNRYTELLRQKAQKDIRIKEISSAVVENVELVKYVNDVLKARIKYKDYENNYTLILSFSTVTSGRIFLNDYFIFKSKEQIEKTG